MHSELKLHHIFSRAYIITEQRSKKVIKSIGNVEFLTRRQILLQGYPIPRETRESKMSFQWKRMSRT